MEEYADTYLNSETSFPSFADNADWDQIKIIRAATRQSDRSPYEAFDYTTELASMREAFEQLGMTYERKTHAMRGSAVVMCELAGVQATSIGIHGGWTSKQGALELSYLTNIRHDAVRALAGFDPAGGQYWLPRDIDPPPELEAQVFPEVDSWYAAPLLCAVSLTDGHVTGSHASRQVLGARRPAHASS